MADRPPQVAEPAGIIRWIDYRLPFVSSLSTS